MRSLKSHATALAFLLTGLVATPVFALDVIHVESGDAGQSPEAAQEIAAATVIEGTLSDPTGLPSSNDVDMYAVCLSGERTFSARADGLANGPFFPIDATLALFDSDGRGIYFNDNSGDGGFPDPAVLPAGHPLTPAAPGKYYLAITHHGVRAIASDASFMFADLPNDVVAPSSTAPLVGWLPPFLGSNPGNYRIALTGVVACPTSPTFTVSDFLPPINPGAVNNVKAGRTIPVKWLLTDADGNPVDDPTSFVSITSDPGGGICTGLASETIESTTGASGLQYLGNGLWQFNWKTSSNYAGQCRLMTLTLSDGTEASAIFEFK